MHKNNEILTHLQIGESNPYHLIGYALASIASAYRQLYFCKDEKLAQHISDRVMQHMKDACFYIQDKLGQERNIQDL